MSELDEFLAGAINGNIANIIQFLDEIYGYQQPKIILMETTTQTDNHNKFLCKICLERDICKVFDCGHTCCQQCFNAMTMTYECRCHICDAEITAPKPLII